MWLVLAATASSLGHPEEKDSTQHPQHPKGSERATLDEETSKVSAQLPTAGSSAGPILRNSFIDDFIFGRMKRDKIPHAGLSSDSEFLRRVFLDLTGLLPPPDRVREFLKDENPEKRNHLIDELTDAKVDPGLGDHPVFPFLDRWTFFFSDLFRNTGQNLDAKGRNLFWDYLNMALLLNVPYDQVVTELLTAKARSSWLSGPANYLARLHVDGADGLANNHEDTIEDIAISNSKAFLGVNLECISCHDGAGHLEGINLWLSRRKREEFWRHASFFGGIRIRRGFGIGNEFPVEEGPHRYDLEYPSVKRVTRYPADTTATFLLSGESAKPGEHLRRAYARILTSNRQFARATVNLIWAELMGVGIVDPPLDFDLDRQDPKNPPPEPWTVQPTHPEFLEALADDFVASNYDLRHLIKTIVKSSAYQLSSQFRGEWKPEYAPYFARRYARRLPAEQLYDAIAEATGVYEEIKVAGTDETVKYIVQARCPLDLSEEVKDLLVTLGLSNRDLAEKTLAGSMVHASIFLNSRLIKERVEADKGRLKQLLEADPVKSNEEIVEELFLATLGRFPTEAEKGIGITQIERYRDTGAEDLLWSLLNKPEFFFNH